MISCRGEEGPMGSATLREIHANPHLALAKPAPAADDYGWLDDDPDLEPYLAPGVRAWRARKETPLEAFF
jgi:hypothetical protein